MRQQNNKQENITQQKKGRYILLLVVIGVLAAGGLLWYYAVRENDPAHTAVLRIGEEVVYLDELNFNILQNIDSMELDMEADTSDLEDQYKEDLLHMVMDYRVEAMVAQQQGITLTEEEQSTIRQDAVAFMGTVDGSALRKLGITQECIMRIYTNRYLAHALEEEATSDLEVEPQNFCTLYVMFFPKIQMDEQGDYIRQEDGETPVMLSEELIAQRKKDAEDARAALLDGKDAEEVARQYGVEAYSSEQSNLAGSFEESINGYAESLHEGECSPVLELSSCFLIVDMLEENDAEKAEEILNYYRSDQEKEIIGEKRKAWYQETGVSEEPDLVGNTWKKISLYDFTQYGEE